MIDNVKSLISYDPETGLFTWLVSRSRTKAGSRAGNVKPDGYIAIKVGGRNYLAHRLAWLMVHGEMPAEEIDHINGNRSDNRLSNLRPANRQQNSRHRCRRADSTSGFKGVSPRRGKFQATICVDGGNKYLGDYATPEEAHAAYCKVARERFGEFARFF